MSDRKNPLLALTQARIREFVREPGALVWVFGFPILMSVVLGFAFRDHPPDPVPVGVVGGPGVAAVTQSHTKAGTTKPRPHAPLPEGLEALRPGKIALLVEEDEKSEPGLVYRFDPTRPDARIAPLRRGHHAQPAAGGL